MVKGVSKQVIVVTGPDRELFDQAIFILKDSAVKEGITEEKLLKEAKQVLRHPEGTGSGRMHGSLWACGGAAVTGILWLLTAIL